MARKYLIEQGMVLVESNYEIKSGEIDLIMADDDWLVFVEVKYKHNADFGRPEEMINGRKICQIKRVAQYFLMENVDIRQKFKKYRLDAVCILGKTIKHYQNIG